MLKWFRLLELRVIMSRLIIIILSLLILNEQCFSSVRSSFRMIDSIFSKRLFSTVYQVHDRTIYDPLSFEQKKEMNRFITSGFLPKYDLRKIKRRMWSDKYNSQSPERPIEKYFKKRPDSIIGSYTCTKSCPPLLTSLELPVSIDFFKNNKLDFNLTL